MHKITLLCSALISCFLFSSNASASNNIQIIRSVQTSPSKIHGGSIHVSVRDNFGHAEKLQHAISSRLHSMGFNTTPQPSKADRIIALEILSRGTFSLNSITNTVYKGYGKELILYKDKGWAIIADLILLRRNIPLQDKKSSLRSISSRNTTGSIPMRIAFHANTHSSMGQLEAALCQEIALLAVSTQYKKSFKQKLTQNKKSRVQRNKKSSSIKNHSTKNKNINNSKNKKNKNINNSKNSNNSNNKNKNINNSKNSNNKKKNSNNSKKNNNNKKNNNKKNKKK